MHRKLPAKKTQNTLRYGNSWMHMEFQTIGWCLPSSALSKGLSFLSGQDTLISSGWCRFGQPVPVTEPKTSKVPKRRIPAGSEYVVSSHARANVQAWMDSPVNWPLSFNSRYPVKRSKVGFKLNMTVFLSLLHQNSKPLFNSQNLLMGFSWSTSGESWAQHGTTMTLAPCMLFSRHVPRMFRKAPPRFQSQNMPIPTQKKTTFECKQLVPKWPLRKEEEVQASRHCKKLSHHSCW